MIYKLYAVRDNKGLLFMAPQLQVNEDTARRDFAMAVNNAQITQQIGFAPGDFDLYEVGLFDSESGNITSVPVPVFIVNGRACLEVDRDEK